MEPLSFPKGPCTQIVYTLAPKYVYRDDIKANVSTIWVHGPLGFLNIVPGPSLSTCEDRIQRAQNRLYRAQKLRAGVTDKKWYPERLDSLLDFQHLIKEFSEKYAGAHE